MLIDIYSKSSRSSRIALMAAVALIVVVGSYNRLIEPFVQGVQAAQRYANEMGSFTQKQKMLESKLKIAQLAVEKLLTKTVEMQDRIFTVFAAQQFFASLELIASETNCVITSLNQLGPETSADKTLVAAAGITSHRAAMSLVGDYSSIMKFLTQMLDRPNRVLINPFSIATRQDDSGKLECSFILTIYVLDDENNKGADANAH